MHLASGWQGILLVLTLLVELDTVAKHPHSGISVKTSKNSLLLLCFRLARYMARGERFRQNVILATLLSLLFGRLA
jgi:hypothetical protein